MMEENLVALIEQSITDNWRQPALSNYKADTRTYKEVGKRILEIHDVYKELDIQPDDKIALLGKNSINWAIAYLATVSYGAVLVPILSDFHTRDIAHIIKHSESIFLFSDDNLFEDLETDSIDNIKAVFSLENFECLFTRKKKMDKKIKKAKDNIKERSITPDVFSLPSVAKDKLASIAYTSGTTGFSKGVMTTHNNLVANIIYAFQNMPIRSGDNILSFLPLAHSFGCAFEFLFPFCRGAHITFLNKIPSPRIILEAFDNVKPRLILTVPLILEKIYNKKIKPKINSQPYKALLSVPGVNKMIYKKIKDGLVDAFGGEFMELVIGGAPLNDEVEAFLKKIEFPFTIGYGMTECAPLISYAGWKEHKTNSVGQPVFTLDVKIDSKDPENEVGEIMVKGENLFKGYYKDEETTRNNFEDGWFHTGDLGTIDNDNFIFIRGRSKSMILGPSGQNIFPEEIESKVNNLPYVQESVVIERSNKLVALVYPDYEAMDSEGIEERQLKDIMQDNRKKLNQNLPQYSRLNKFELYPEEFEKSPTKKIKRYLYR
ncbi:MAG TPA: AMP-binding protein [bacterium]|nr:AMP-binding protein [bacterium]